MPKPTIILLEDDEALRALVADGLRHDGYVVTPLPNAAGLDQELDRLGGDAVLVADRQIGTEKQNGFDVASTALERYPALRVVYCSGTQLALKHRALSPRERSLLKPFALSQLTNLLRQLPSAAATPLSRANT